MNCVRTATGIGKSVRALFFSVKTKLLIRLTPGWDAFCDWVNPPLNAFFKGADPYKYAIIAGFVFFAIAFTISSVVAVFYNPRNPNFTQACNIGIVTGIAAALVGSFVDFCENQKKRICVGALIEFKAYIARFILGFLKTKKGGQGGS